MKVQIKSFSTHQTAKVFAILMAVTSLIFIIPFSLIPMLASTGSDNGIGAFGFLFLFMPLVQGVFGYVIMRLGMWVYNKLTTRIGGIEFEIKEMDRQ